MEDKKADRGDELRKNDIQVHIDKIQEKKKKLETRGRELLEAGKAEDPEYDSLIEQHRFLRGKQRFFEGMQSEVGPSPEFGIEARQKDAASRELSLDRANRQAETVDALDRLRKEALEKEL
jgi:hypothetical protein